jgi:predicted ATP-dependent endonuclease of OLD family
MTLEYIKDVWINGLRGVSGELPLHLAIPNGNPGSGMTVLVGANNSGKSTIVQAFQALAKSRDDTPSFSIGKRDVANPHIVRIYCTFDNGKQNWLESFYRSSETYWLKREDEVDIRVVPARRGFEPYLRRATHIAPDWRIIATPTSRTSQASPYRPQLLEFSDGRSFEISSSEDWQKFDKLLGRVMGSEPPEWTIDQLDSGEYFVKFLIDRNRPHYYHSSEGVGDGVISLFAIVLALYDSQPRSVIVIDEPELSLHPHYQRRLRDVLSDLSKDRQIVCATHSPYFVNWRDIANGAKITRIYKEHNTIKLAEASRLALEEMVRSLEDTHHPHTLGLNANEVFFLDDDIIITEGQEDVVYFEKVSKAINMRLQGEFYGWGAGGAPKIKMVCRLLHDMGYSRVVGIFDNDKEDAKIQCQEEFEDYKFVLLPAADIHDKRERMISAKEGLLQEGGQLREDKRDATIAMYHEINAYLQGNPGAA